MTLACAWPGCDATTDTTLLVDPAFDSGAGALWCFDHALDDFLPELAPGVSNFCDICRAPSVLWLGTGRHAVCLHERCRRAFLIAPDRDPVIEVAPPPEVPLRGAYARRAAQQAR